MNEVLEVTPVLRVTDLKQHVFCPRIPFYQRVLGLQGPPTYAMERAKDLHEVWQQLEKRRVLKRYGLEQGARHFNVPVRSDTLGLSGVIDLVIDTGEQAVPVEVKITESTVQPNHRLQLQAYAMLLAESWSHEVAFGFIYLSPRRKAVHIDLDDEARAQVTAAVEAVRETIMSECLPAATPHRVRCTGCEYQNFCGDVW